MSCSFEFWICPSFFGSFYSWEKCVPNEWVSSPEARKCRTKHTILSSLCAPTMWDSARWNGWQLWVCSLRHETYCGHVFVTKNRHKIKMFDMFSYIPSISMFPWFFPGTGWWHGWWHLNLSHCHGPIIWGPQLESPQQPTVRARRVQRPETPNSIALWRSMCRSIDLKDVLRVPYWWINWMCFFQVDIPGRPRKNP